MIVSIHLDLGAQRCSKLAYHYLDLTLWLIIQVTDFSRPLLI